MTIITTKILSLNQTLDQDLKDSLAESIQECNRLGNRSFYLFSDATGCFNVSQWLKILDLRGLMTIICGINHSRLANIDIPEGVSDCLIVSWSASPYVSI